MKQLVVCLSMTLLSIGCVGQSYSNVRVGPDRFAVVSKGHDAGPENYGKLLNEAYNTCSTAGFKDYSVTSIAHEPRRVVVFVRCTNEPVAQTLEPHSEEKSTSSFMTDLDNFYQNTKKKLQEKLKE